MKQERKNVRLTLTPEQREEIRRATGTEAEVLELTAEELEERIAPGGGGTVG